MTVPTSHANTVENANPDIDNPNVLATPDDSLDDTNILHQMEKSLTLTEGMTYTVNTSGTPTSLESPTRTTERNLEYHDEIDEEIREEEIQILEEIRRHNEDERDYYERELDFASRESGNWYTEY